MRLARHYYSKLFREYCIADLSRYKVRRPRLRSDRLFRASTTAALQMGELEPLPAELLVRQMKAVQSPKT